MSEGDILMWDSPYINTMAINTLRYVKYKYFNNTKQLHKPCLNQTL